MDVITFLAVAALTYLLWKIRISTRKTETSMPESLEASIHG